MTLKTLLIVCSLLPVLAQAGDGPNLDPETQFYVAKHNMDAIKQFADLMSSGDMDAALIWEMVGVPQSVWFNGDTPKKTKQAVKNTVKIAAGKQTVPVLVAYNIPFRNCAPSSAGGATTAQEYMDWIDEFAAGIGDKNAVVILEPDGLGIIPWYKQFRGLPSEGGYEWCQPTGAVEATAADDRFAMLNYAVDKLKAQPNTLVYLDGTNSGWLGSGDAAHRLEQAGIDRADGFFLNVSDYRLTSHLQKYGTWIAKCFWFSTDTGSWGFDHFDWCASQYYPADPNDFSTWGLTDQWYADNVESQTSAPYPGDAGWKSFVIDTSRNGQGHWTPIAVYPDPQVWCNPPGRGLGLTPTADTGSTLIDAYLWVQIPGESDGECTRGLGPVGVTVDPEWGLIDPPAAQWFPEMALDLARNANPPLP